jgi:hypothetical protein
MTSRPGRARRAALLPVLVALALIGTPWSRVFGATSPSNSQLLLDAARAVARTLVAQVPLTPGTRVALRAEIGTAAGVETDVADALVMALNDRRIECVLLAPISGPAASSVETAPGVDSTAVQHKEGEVPTLGAFAQLQAERAAQAALADSLKRAGRAAESPAQASVLAGAGTNGNLPLLTYRVPEARVDYVRMFRGGLFGAERIERRATVRIALRLANPGALAVRWSATADTTISDVVMRTETVALEDRLRPETRPTPPTSGLKKVIEPVLVIVLIAGLVSLFYQNRP